jgi:endonuclease III related protein
MDISNPGNVLLNVYQRLYSHYGPQNWWPASEPFEVIVGAILTQSTSWKNVEKSIFRLKQAGVLTPSTLRKLSNQELAELIHSCGYYNVKAKKLKAFSEWFGRNYGDSLDNLFLNKNLNDLRNKLLDIYGIGEETADSILLYAGNKPAFVIDAYTRRVIDRLGISVQGPQYLHYQELFIQNLPEDPLLFNEYHALFVALCKDTCLKSPKCLTCCLGDICSSRKVIN